MASSEFPLLTGGAILGMLAGMKLPGICVALSFFVGLVGAQAAQHPNILFIISDDHAAHAVSAYGSKINKTPNIDRIAQEGIRLDRCYAVNSICTPSRATILTGQYSHKNGVPVFNAIDPNRPNVAKYLKAAGYTTAAIGKWHLGTDPAGFDYWQILPGQGAYWQPVLYGTDGEKKYEGHTTDVITELTLKFLEKRDTNAPFFMWVGHKAPHRNWQPQTKFANMWTNQVVPEPATLFEEHPHHASAVREQKQSIARDLTPNDLKAAPPAGLSEKELVRWKYQRYMQDYLACVQGVDESVGKILDYLDKAGLAKNTLVIYTSDQGFFLGDHGMYDKRFFHEHSSRMPFVARWPGQIKPGSTTAALAINPDFAPTFLELAGASIPADMQGRSLSPLLRGERAADWRRSFYYRYYHDPGHHNTRAHYGVRTDTHKLIHYPGANQWECFDLTTDPEELNNIYDEPGAKSIVASLKTELTRLQRELDDTQNLYADPTTWPKTTADVRPPSQRNQPNAQQQQRQNRNRPNQPAP